MSSTSTAYAKAGVNIALADSVKSGLKQKVRRTVRPEGLRSSAGLARWSRLIHGNTKSPSSSSRNSKLKRPYPQPVRRQPTVEYLPLPRGRETNGRRPAAIAFTANTPTGWRQCLRSHTGAAVTEQACPAGAD